MRLPTRLLSLLLPASLLLGAGGEAVAQQDHAQHMDAGASSAPAAVSDAAAASERARPST